MAFPVTWGGNGYDYDIFFRIVSDPFFLFKFPYNRRDIIANRFCKAGGGNSDNFRVVSLDDVSKPFFQVFPASVDCSFFAQGA